MKKIGVMTFHGADNLGAVLQAYALTDFLNRNDSCCAEIVDYRCAAVEKTKYATPKGNPIKYLLLSGYYFIKRSGFSKFRKKYLPLSQDVYLPETIQKANDHYDYFIAGSDQIWNLECSGNDFSYFLNFTSESKKRISYAASIGTYRYKDDDYKKMQELVTRFDAVSVREINAVQYFGQIYSDVKLLPDPVFLLERQDWEKMVPRRRIKEKYILVYIIQEDVNVLKSAEEYAKKNGCKIVNNKKSIEFMLHNSPDEFLGWIYHAEAVFTNSFHGTAFSVLFNKKLAADIELKNGGVNNRIIDVLKLVEGKNCIISSETTYPFAVENNGGMDDVRGAAKDFLINALV